MDRIRVSVVCANFRVGELERNCGTIIDFSRKAAESGSDIVCFPEMSLSGYAMPKSFDLCLSKDSPEIGGIVDLSGELDLAIVFGFAEEGNFISQAVAEKGKLIGIYRKTHLGQNEKPCAAPGAELPVFGLSKADIGIQLCVESHYPEISGTYGVKGADIILMPHASGLNAERRRATWNKVLPARAYDNTVFVAACNQFGDNGAGTRFSGGACFLDCRGNLISEDFSGECMLTADLDGTEQDELRTDGNRDMRTLYYLDRRRPELYFR